MPEELKVSLLKMFGKLKQTVLWKFEEDLPNKPSNVHIIKWAPQQSILEAVHFGRPIIGIPVFGDQFNNVDLAVNRGFAKRVDLSYTMTHELQLAIKDMISDPSYTTKVKQLSLVYHHCPVSPGKELVHWVEHVVRTGGAPHLRSPALLVPWYQKCYLDLPVLVIVILSVAILGLKRVIGKFSKKQKKKLH